MLDRGKFLDLFSHGKYDNTSRMLSCASPDTGAALDNTVDLTVTLVLSPLFIIILHITKCRLIRQGTDGTGLEGLAFSENNLCIMMGIRLIFTGEVQVDIRLLVSLESKEGLKWNIKSLLLSSWCRTSGRSYPAYRSLPYLQMLSISGESKSLYLHSGLGHR